MKKVLIAPIALTAALAMGGCASEKTPAPQTPSQPAASQAAPASPATPQDQAETPMGDNSATPAPAGGEANGGGATPEEAVVVFTKALATGDAKLACQNMQANGKRAADTPAMMESCAKQMQIAADGVKTRVGEAKADSIKITGATVNGTRAEFTNAQVEPADLTDYVHKLVATQIDGRWYIGPRSAR